MKNFIPYLILPTLVALTARCGGSEDGDASGGAGGTAGSAGSAGSAGTAGDAGAPDPCTTQGATRQISCGNCGTQDQTCASDGYWSNVGACTGGGECAANAEETRNDGTCNAEKRTCNTTCTWSAWSPANADPCTPGETTYDNTGCQVGQLIKKSCGMDCQWTTTACGNQCKGTPRTSPPEAEEVCVPAGEFVRGDDDFADSSPKANVYLSEYYIDRYPVTNKRYKACVSAGSCQPVQVPVSPTRDDYPAQNVLYLDALAFCQWDEGRAMATEAQWEKAARGPAPRWTKFLWGANPDCLQTAGPCPPSGQPMSTDTPFKYNELSSMRGFYGAEHMGHSAFELTRDGYESEFYSKPESLSDPVGSYAISGEITMRGYRFYTATEPVGRRLRQLLGSIANHTMFRCTRRP